MGLAMLLDGRRVDTITPETVKIVSLNVIDASGDGPLRIWSSVSRPAVAPPSNELVE